MSIETRLLRTGLRIPFNLDYASYSGNSLSVSSQEPAPNGLWINAAESRAYIVGSVRDRVYQYTISDPSDISSGSYASLSFSVNSQAPNPSCVFFSPDESKMYVGNGTGIYQYTIGTPGNVSTATYDSVSFALSVIGIFISSDGTKLLTCGTTSDNIEEYTLSTPWNISTASAVDSTGALPYASPLAEGIAASPDGTVVMLCDSGGDLVASKEFPIAFSAGDALAGYNVFGISSQDNEPSDIHLNSNGSRLYLIGRQNDAIYQYNISA